MAEEGDRSLSAPQLHWVCMARCWEQRRLQGGLLREAAGSFSHVQQNQSHGLQETEPIKDGW